MSAYLHLIRTNPNARYLWIAQLVSLLGDWFSLLALSGLIEKYSPGNSGLAISGLLIARTIPPLFISPLAGVLVDRLNRQKLLIFSDVARAILTLGFLFIRGADTLWVIYVLSVLLFMISAIFEPGRAALLPSVVAEKDLLTANNLSNITWSAMLAFGAMIGGVTAATLGTDASFLVDAATFALSAFFINRIHSYHYTPPAPHTHADEHRKGSFFEGLRFILATPAIFAVLFIKLGLSVGSSDWAMIVYGTKLFPIGTNGIISMGILYGVFGIGAVIGPSVFGRFHSGSIVSLRRATIASFVCVTLGWFVLGAAPTLFLTAIALIIRAIGGSVTWTYSSTILQLSTPDAFLGRVFSFDWVGFYSASTISILISGLVFDNLGIEYVRTIIFAFGAFSLVPLIAWTVAVFWLERHHEKQP